LIKDNLCLAFVLALPYFELLLKDDYDVIRIGIGVAVNQAKHPPCHSSEKLNRSRLHYSTYNKEFYDIIKALERCNYYLKHKSLLLCFGSQGIILYDWPTLVEHKTCQEG